MSKQIPVIDVDECIACGNCEAVCPEVFRLNEALGHSEVINPHGAPPEAIQKDTADTLLTKLVKRNDPRFRAASFILAVMLERKRILKVRGQTTENGRRVFIYEHSRSGDVFTILDPDLQLNQLEEVQREVADRKSTRLNSSHT